MSRVVETPLARCGHPHQLWSSQLGHRAVKPGLWRVVAAVEARAPADDRDWKPVRLEPGTLLRHDQSDWTMQGCAACEDYFVWERFAVLDGLQAGRCVEFGTIKSGTQRHRHPTTGPAGLTYQR